MTIQTFATLKANMPIGTTGGTSVQDVHDIVDTMEEVTTQQVVDIYASYTATVADNRRFFTVGNAAATTFTIPNNVPRGWECAVMQIGAGRVTIAVAGTGGPGNLWHADDHTKTNKQNSMVFLKCIWNDQNIPTIGMSGDTAL